MVTLRRCRELLPNGDQLTDDEVTRVRDQMRAIAEVAITSLTMRRAAGGDHSEQQTAPKGRMALPRPQPQAREEFEERAAILEYEAGLPRPDAERRALLQIVGRPGEK
jgi:hypothetical protein